MKPSISCIMPTYDRPTFVPGAIAYFMRQTVADAELIIIDDGSQPVQDLIPADPRVRYLRLPERRPVGAKRNLACGLARGELVAHWDDDDWYAPDRLQRQAVALQEADAKLCGLNVVLFYDTRPNEGRRYAYPPTERPWLAGSSLMYRRAFWSTHRFPEIDLGEDSLFVWSANPQDLVTLTGPSIHVGIIHNGNTSDFDSQGPWWHTHPLDEIRRLLGDDWGRYAPAEMPIPA
jgi:glycosyltransferase involved in cell wall biosynthesis